MGECQGVFGSVAAHRQDLGRPRLMCSALPPSQPQSRGGFTRLHVRVSVLG